MGKETVEIREKIWGVAGGLAIFAVTLLIRNYIGMQENALFSGCFLAWVLMIRDVYLRIYRNVQKGKVFDVVQTGYTLNGKVIRFAKVVVGI